ncbi:hypothetical protein P5P86_06795 [Nocardioides sp. BP30]|uniref:hypothetical protein n=1 Tax=Nocardioides sp. BP30 TaxID=3036374 RepID=UPI00246869E7|nr:hypothetical protein [Nocardioides sp. BP30]WGL53535.1 hypothetical protein P5P86_06795 [Nocardioides sp. BP30]
MTWTSYHNRGEVLRAVVAAADERRDGRLPMDVAGVRERFTDELDLLGALQLKWHTAFSGRIERELDAQPMDLEEAVVAAWHGVCDAMPGVRAVLDHYAENPLDERMAQAVGKAVAKERMFMAAMAGRGAPQDELTAPAGARIEAAARASYVPAPRRAPERLTLLGRIRAALAA